tara:strand:+ start:11004 stop:11576 length:573 start_codon:yes stop_codon:yes gene_type:complete
MCESNDGDDGGGSAGGVRQNRNHDGNVPNDSMTPNRTGLSADQAISIVNNPFSPHNQGQYGEKALAALGPIMPGGIPLNAGRTLAMMGGVKAGKGGKNNLGNKNEDRGDNNSPSAMLKKQGSKRAVAGNVAAKSKENAPLAKDDDDELGGDAMAFAPYTPRNRVTRQSTMLTGSRGIRARANIGRTLLGA